MFGYQETKCCSCNTQYWIPNALAEAKEKTRNDKNPIASYCPYGHGNVRTSDATICENDKLRMERDRLAQRIAAKDDEIKRQRELRDHAERSASAYKGKVTRLKNRAAAGLCPCCNRTFQNLHKHMTTQHPEFKKEDDAA